MITTIIPHGGRLITILEETMPRSGKRQPVYSRMLVQITTAGAPRVIRSSLLWGKYDLIRFLTEKGVL